jgi:hypothetical protein
MFSPNVPHVADSKSINAEYFLFVTLTYVVLTHRTQSNCSNSSKCFPHYRDTLKTLYVSHFGAELAVDPRGWAAVILIGSGTRSST